MQPPIKIGMTWGDFPWENPPQKIGKLFSHGATARNTTRAFNLFGEVVPFDDPKDSPADFLKNVDVVFADVYPHTEQFLRARVSQNIDVPMLLWAGGAMPKGADALLFPWQDLLQPCDQLVFTCKADQTIWHRLTHQNTLGEWVIPLPVDQTIFRPQENHNPFRSEFKIPPKTPLLLYVGRLNIQKNIHSLFYTLANVREKYPEAVLCLVGEEDDIALGEFKVPNTGYVQELNHLANTLDLQNNVIFTGPLLGADLAKAYTSADLLLNLGFYHRENFGLAQAEAQACGLPVVCSNWGGFKDVVRHGKTGFLVDAVLSKNGIRVDWKGASQHVIQCLGDKSHHTKLSQAAHAFAAEHFTTNQYAQRLQTAVEAALNHSKATESPTYTPSDFSNQYETHKKMCGWYDSPTHYPKMFQGHEYDLYRTIIGPYATYDAIHLPASDIDDAWVPYLSPWAEKYAPRQMIQDNDLIWPARHYLTGEEWELIESIDGKTSIGQIHRTVPNAKNVIQKQHAEGIIQFLKPNMSAQE